jgi:hypothetical protein
MLSGCFAVVTDQKALAQAKEPVYCDGADECGIKWSRALDYVSKHSGRPFQTMTDTFAQTPAPQGSAQMAATLRKEPLGRGRYRIALQVVCGNNYLVSKLCEPLLQGYVVGFNQSVNAPLPSEASEAVDRSTRIHTTTIGPGLSKSHVPNAEKRANKDGSDLDLRIVPVSSN